MRHWRKGNRLLGGGRRFGVTTLVSEAASILQSALWSGRGFRLGVELLDLAAIAFFDDAAAQL
jgi:hypothetical protein